MAGLRMSHRRVKECVRRCVQLVRVCRLRMVSVPTAHKIGLREQGPFPEGPYVTTYMQ